MKKKWPGRVTDTPGPRALEMSANLLKIVSLHGQASGFGGRHARPEDEPAVKHLSLPPDVVRQCRAEPG
jgi:hypothetical protein